MTFENQEKLHRQPDSLYERYARPLEAEHWGEYVVISPAGEMVLGSTLIEAAQAAATSLGPGNFAFRVGQRSVATWK